jgi:hypothetical protein
LLAFDHLQKFFYYNEKTKMALNCSHKYYVLIHVICRSCKFIQRRRFRFS